jgi:2-succinyl-6-hydroxy-2,4-cyclohexadiene-1-carboxylate synthase
MEIIENKFENIFYTYFKNDNSNHTLLFLHGFTGTSSVWNDYAEILKSKFNIILIDLSGHGNSESPKTIEEYSFQNQAEKIIKLLTSLGIKSISIISYSFSCYIGLLIREEMRQETKSMIFVSPYFKEKFNFFEKIIFKFIKFIWRYLIPDKKFQLDYSKLKNYENPTFHDTKYTLKCTNTKDILGSVYSLKNQGGIPDLEILEIPTLLIYGKNDKMLSDKVKSIFTKLKVAETEVIENKKHLFLKTEVLKIAKVIETFLTKLLFPLQ